MIKATQTFRYLLVNTRRIARQVFSSRDALSLILIAGLPFVMASSFSINHAFLQNRAFAYAASSASDMSSPEMERMTRQFAAQVKGNPDMLLKLKGAHIDIMFSTPGLLRAEGDMQFRQYRTSHCVLDMYIAQDGTGDVLHYETRARAKRETPLSAVEARDCVRSVFNGHDGDAPSVFALSFSRTMR